MPIGSDEIVLDDYSMNITKKFSFERPNILIKNSKQNSKL